jgi:RNA polymerase sigma factor (sigma-70 family)
MEAERERLEALFLEHLSWIERVTQSFSRRNRLNEEDASDFESWVKLKLIEHDYYVLQRFRGESSLTTYLTTVIAMLAREYCVRYWGRWRPSAAAQRLGTLAIRLETLVFRDKYRLVQAIELLRVSGQTDLTVRELIELFSSLPERTTSRPTKVGTDVLENEPAVTETVDPVEQRETERERDHVNAALRTALSQLPPEDNLILRMSYWKNMRVAEIARALDLPQKSLYRRLTRLQRKMRKQLESAGLSDVRIRELLDDLLRD